MSSVRGLVGGFVGLALLEATVSKQDAAGRVGGIFDTAASILSRWLDPNVPLIPDLRGGTANPFTDAGPGGSITVPPLGLAQTPGSSTYATPRRLPAAPATPSQPAATVNA